MMRKGIGAPGTVATVARVSLRGWARILSVCADCVYDGNASKASITPHHRLAERVAADGKAHQGAGRVGQLEKSAETQLSRTDPDARLLSKRGQAVAGYNVQIAVERQAQAHRGERGRQ